MTPEELNRVLLQGCRRSYEPFCDPHFGELPRGDGLFPSVSLVMAVGGNQFDLLVNVLESLFRNTPYPNWQIILVDNLGAEELRNALLAVPKSLLVVNDAVAACSVNRNRGMQECRADYHVCLDSDVLIEDPLWLYKLVALAESDASIGAVGGGLNTCGSFWRVDRDGIARAYHFLERKFRDPRPFECQVAQGHCILLKRTALDKVGLFDEGFRPVYGEETDLCTRLCAHGYRVMDTCIGLTHVGQGDNTASFGEQKTNLLLQAADRRVAMRWGALLPHEPLPTYESAQEYLAFLRSMGPSFLACMPDLPPTTNAAGEIHPLFKPFPPAWYDAKATLAGA